MSRAWTTPLAWGRARPRRRQEAPAPPPAPGQGWVDGRHRLRQHNAGQPFRRVTEHLHRQPTFATPDRQRLEPFVGLPVGSLPQVAAARAAQLHGPRRGPSRTHTVWTSRALIERNCHVRLTGDSSLNLTMPGSPWTNEPWRRLPGMDPTTRGQPPSLHHLARAPQAPRSEHSFRRGPPGSPPRGRRRALGQNPLTRTPFP